MADKEEVLMSTVTMTGTVTTTTEIIQKGGILPKRTDTRVQQREDILTTTTMKIEDTMTMTNGENR